MKSLIALALLAVVCAAVDPEPALMPEPAIPYLDEVKLADMPQDFESDDGPRVLIVEQPEPDFAVDEIAEQFEDGENFEGLDALAPSELESVRVDLPEGYDPLYGFEERDPMWR